MYSKIQLLSMIVWRSRPFAGQAVGRLQPFLNIYFWSGWWDSASALVGFRLLGLATASPCGSPACSPHMAPAFSSLRRPSSWPAPAKKIKIDQLCAGQFLWSGWRDSNPQPLGPKPSTLAY